jgi:hypothetical protein
MPLYTAAMGMGHENNDTAAVFDVLERMSSPPIKSTVKKSVARKG